MWKALTAVLLLGVAWALLAQESTPELKVGDKAPAFRLTGTDGKEYTLEQYQGKSAVVLVWYPKAMTPGCTTECNSLRDESAALSRFRAQVFGISVDPVEANKAFAEKQGYRFPLLSDPEKKAARAYGVLGPTGFARRLTFVIDDQGVIRAIDRAVKPADYGQTLAKMLADLGIPAKKD